MDVGILEPKEVPDFGTDFVFSAFLPDPATTETVKEHLSSGTDITSPVFTYSHVRDYEGNLINPAIKNDYAVYFLNERHRKSTKRSILLVNFWKIKFKTTTNDEIYIYCTDDKIDGIELTLRGQTSEEAEVYERAKKEFEEGGPKVEEEEEMVETPDDDDGLSDTDAIGEVDPMYTR